MFDLAGGRDMKRMLLLVLLLPFCTLPAVAQNSISLDGYLKSFFTVFRLPDYGNLPFLADQTDLGAVNNRVRLKLRHQHGGWFTANLAYDFSPRIQDPVLFENQLLPVGINPLSYRAFDWNARLYPGEDEIPGSFGIFHNLDRAAVEIKTSPADLIIGRQAIAWGSGRVINPTDVIAPFAFQELDTEERIGVDAVRVRVPLNALAEVDAGYVFGKDFKFDQSAFFARSKFYLAKTDVSLLLLGFRENLLLGFDLARSLGGAGFWLETARVFVDRFNDDSGGEARAYFRGVTGLDYSFSGRVYGFLEYHFNDAGAGRPGAYIENFSAPAYIDGAVYLMGRHYLAPGMVYQLSPLIALNAQMLFNLGDRSAFLTSQAEYNIAQNIYLAAGAFFRFGQSPQIVSGGTIIPELRLQSEFGSYPNIFFTAFRVYF
ncbi:hypothetical protein EDS67_23535 [candidate division KSB1 bacterium]|nr:MAG: hypothetical protein EDS67_23535 [candidate division KSB1 bacterium]MBC6949129.1 hypothetical protein [candidate division KSB1 bacterium]MCE7944348.1 hypothetical protein [Chlorobi bacterium CHB1]